ncbi:hypothetical protein GCM10011387_31270 [Pedobacter quisquiliarum]|uniref:NACHT domain-containing protein n=1 Tax=Pedobacter quisquiliarum TaxID=1834438 RepID=A0A916UJC7_9SPHI|nr:hypothetical protein [Pedobacter quisquiliarum]GGC75278.1 hypothetical protein GCM10011387_31270 [Pedobacter quisquiliarum]
MIDIKSIFDIAFSWVINESNLFIKTLTLPVLYVAITKGWRWIYKKIKDANEKRNLHPFYSSQTIKYAKQNYIRTKCQNIDPANELNYKSTFAFSTKEDLLSFFLNKVFKIKDNETRFYLILADSGMGKSTFMLNLFSRATSLMSWFSIKSKIKLFPLGENLPDLTARIQRIENQHDTILLLDGFDEIPTVDNNNNIKEKFDHIIDLVKNFKTVIITCRTHFFSSELDEPFELKVKKFNTNGNGYHQVKKLYISPFDEIDIRKYINKSFRIYQFRRKKTAYEIIHNTGDLMVRPMLLSYITDLTEINRQKLRSNFEVYESLIDSWMNRESNKYEVSKRHEFKYNLVYFTYSVVRYIHSNYETNGLYIPLEKAVSIAESFQINLDDIEIKSRSLLNRNSLGDYKFSHKSIFEFFIAYLSYMGRDIDGDIYSFPFDLSLYDESKNFIEEIIKFDKTEFLLPVIDERKDTQNYNKKLFAEIMKRRNLEINIEWLTERSFKLKRINT